MTTYYAPSGYICAQGDSGAQAAETDPPTVPQGQYAVYLFWETPKRWTLTPNGPNPPTPSAPSPKPLHAPDIIGLIAIIAGADKAAVALSALTAGDGGKPRSAVAVAMLMSIHTPEPIFPTDARITTGFAAMVADGILTSGDSAAILAAWPKNT